MTDPKAPTPPPADDAAEPRTRRRPAVCDPEVSAIADIGRILGELPEPSLSRVLTWVVDKYAPPGVAGKAAS